MSAHVGASNGDSNMETTASAPRLELGAGARLIVAAILLGIVVTTIRFLAGSWSFLNDGSGYNLIFVSAALLLVLGVYVAEPYFSRPADVIVNTVAIIVALMGVRNPQEFAFHGLAMASAVAILVVAIVVVALPRQVLPRTREIAYRVIRRVGRSSVLFPALYLLVLASFFMSRPLEFWLLFTVWLLLVFRRPVETFVHLVVGFFRNRARRMGRTIGRVDRRLSPRLVVVHRHVTAPIERGQLVELPTVGERSVFGIAHFDLYRAKGNDTVVEILTDGSEAIAMDRHGGLSTIPLTTPLEGGVCDVDAQTRSRLAADLPALDVVGFVAPGSDMERIEVEIPESFARKANLGVGAVVKADVASEEFLYQVFGARTAEESIDARDSRGYVRFHAHPVGRVKDEVSREIVPPTWIPDIYSAVRLEDPPARSGDPRGIGRLPGTSVTIPILAPHDLVTHNTAVLGVLGVGKTCLAFEIIQKVVSQTDAFVLVIDVTNEYRAALRDYVEFPIRADTVDGEEVQAGDVDHALRSPELPSRSVDDFRAEIAADLAEFLTAEAADSPRVRVVNPDLYRVTAEKKGSDKVVVTVEITLAEKTRIIAEELLNQLRAKGPSRGVARALIVFEEAHSLIPEWSGAHTGERTASNGTARVVMQGRKYGLGCLVIAQRTASVNKSILNQCNTVFGMRIFDDTGKEFLTNYFGRHLVTALPALADRHAIAVGRGLRAKSAMILELNDARDVRLRDD